MVSMGSVRVCGVWPASLVFLLLAGCPGETDPVPDCTDAPPAVEVGNGYPNHVAFVDGAPITMVHGPQGGWHVWVSLALTNLESAVDIHVTITDTTRGDLLGDLNYSMQTGAPVACVGSLGGLLGFLPYDDPDTPEDETPPAYRACDVFEVCAEVTDAAGVVVSDCLWGVATPDPADGTVSC